MSNGSTLSLPEIEDRIAIVRDNIRQLIEQAAAFSGAEDEERNADRIAQQTEELDVLVKQRDALVQKEENSANARFFQKLLPPLPSLRSASPPLAGENKFTPPSAPPL